jgi:hypothetical protein
MAINKNFVIKNGAEINTKLFVVDADTQKIGIGTTSASYDLHVFGAAGNGGIGATYINVTGITTTQALNVLGISTFNTGPILIARGELTGTSPQSLQVGTATTVSGVYVSGNIGVGQTLPNAKLEVVPTASGIAGLFSGTTSADLVRITQLGTGNALVIEDQANPDSTSVVVSGIGSVGIGTNFPRFLLDIDTTTSTGTTAVYVRGDVKITGDLIVDDLILDQASLTTLSVTGFSTLGSVSAGNIILAGITTGINAPGISTFGETTTIGLSNAGVSTLGDALASTLVVSGFSTLGGSSATLLNVSGITTISGGMEASQGINAARLNVAGITTLGQTTTIGLSNAGLSTLGDALASTLVVSGFTTSGATSATLLSVSGITTLGQTTTIGFSNAGVSTLGDALASTLVVSGFTTSGATSATLLSVSGITTISGGMEASQGINAARLNVSGITTVGVVTGGTSIQAGVFYGDGSQLQHISAGVGIQSAGIVIGYGVTTLNFVGTGNTFAVNGNTVNISIAGGGGGAGFATYLAGIATAVSVGVNTTNLDDPDLTGIGNSFQGLYIGNGMIIVDNALNGNHYIGTNFNGLMAGPVTVNGTLTVDGNWVVV